MHINLQEFFKLNLFWGPQIFSITSLRGTLICFLNVPVPFSHRILFFRLMTFSITMQHYLLYFCAFRLFLQVEINNFESENKLVNFSSFFKVFSGFWYSSLFTAMISLWEVLMESISAPARRRPSACPICVSDIYLLFGGPAVAGVVFFMLEARKKHNHFETLACLGPGAQIL